MCAGLITDVTAHAHHLHTYLPASLPARTYIFPHNPGMYGKLVECVPATVFRNGHNWMISSSTLFLQTPPLSVFPPHFRKVCNTTLLTAATYTPHHTTAIASHQRTSGLYHPPADFTSQCCLYKRVNLSPTIPRGSVFSLPTSLIPTAFASIACAIDTITDGAALDSSVCFTSSLRVCILIAISAILCLLHGLS